MERAVRVCFTEHFERLRLRCCGKRKERQIFVLGVSYHFLHELVVAVDLVLGFALDLGVFVQSVLRIGKHGFQLYCRAARLRGMRLVHDDGEVSALYLFNLRINNGEFLQRRYDNANTVHIAGILKNTGEFLLRVCAVLHFNALPLLRLRCFYKAYQRIGIEGELCVVCIGVLCVAAAFGEEERFDIGLKAFFGCVVYAHTGTSRLPVTHSNMSDFL